MIFLELVGIHRRASEVKTNELHLLTKKNASVWLTHVCRLASRGLLGGGLSEHKIHGAMVWWNPESQLVQVAQGYTRIHEDHKS